MKRLIASFLLIISAVSATVYARRTFLKEIDSLSDSIQNVIEISENGSDSELNESIDILQKKWQSSGRTLHILVNHGEMDEAEQNITALKETVKHTDRTELRIKCIEALNQLKNLRESEKISLENIL